MPQTMMMLLPVTGFSHSLLTCVLREMNQSITYIHNVHIYASILQNYCTSNKYFYQASIMELVLYQAMGPVGTRRSKIVQVKQTKKNMLTGCL